MIKEIAKILKGRLSEDGFPFADVLAGLAQVVSYQTQNADGNPMTEKMPVAYDVDGAAGCAVSPERAVVPDSSKRGILYFEDLGIRPIDRVSGGALKYQAELVLVCWMNRSRLVGDAYKEITSHAVSLIIKKLKVKSITNEGKFTRFRVIPGRVLPQDAAVFSRYTYKEELLQYLRPPFEFFGMAITVEFCIHPDCIEELNFLPPTETTCY